MRQFRGFTLLEALLVCFILALLFSGMTLMLIESFRVIREMNERSQIINASETALSQITSQARQALSFSSPSPGLGAPGSPDLSFIKVDASQRITGLPFPVPNPAPSPFSATQELSLRYSVDPTARLLFRAVGPVGAAPVVSPLCQGVTSLQAYWQSGCLVVELQVYTDNNSKNLRKRVQCVVAP